MSSENGSLQLTELDQKLNNILSCAGVLEEKLYGEDEEESKKLEADIARIEQGYKALNTRLSATATNRWGYSKAGWLSKQLISKHLNSLKNGLFSIYPIPCKQEGCPYGSSCIALKNGLQPPYGDPCPLEVNTIENLVVQYSIEFKLDKASTTDRLLLQELVQTTLLMDRCQCLMAEEGDILQQVASGSTQQGEIYTQPVVSRYLEAWERLSKRRQAIMDEMMATRKSRKDIKEQPLNEEDIIYNVVGRSDNFFEVEQRPDEFK